MTDTTEMIEALRDLTNHAESFWAFIQGEYGVRLSSDDKEDHNVYKFFQPIDAAKAALSTAQTRKECDANSDSSVRAANRQNNTQPPSVMAGAEAALDAETIQTLLDLLNPLHGSLDEQTYDDKVRENFDAPRDAEYEVKVTAQMERDLTQAVCILEDRRRTALRPTVPGPVLSEEEREFIEACRAAAQAGRALERDQLDLLAIIDRLTGRSE